MPAMSVATNPKFGHYQLNNAMRASKLLQGHKIELKPAQIAASIAKNLTDLDSNNDAKLEVNNTAKDDAKLNTTKRLLQSATTAAIFVNMTLSTSFLLETT